MIRSSTTLTNPGGTGLPTVVGLAAQAIDDKWRALGGAPGAPRVPGPKGLLRIGPTTFYREYAVGKIFSAGDTVWVHGAIGDRYQQLGAYGGWLGLPLTDELDFDGGKVSVFEHGAIYWWADTGTRELREICVQYTGLHCFGETDVDQGSSSDEPYAHIGVMTPSGSSTTFQTRIYDDVDAGESRFEIVELYRGKPSGLVLAATLHEHSGGDTDASRSVVSDIVDKGGVLLPAAAALVPGVGPVLGPLTAAAYDVFRSTLAEALNSFLESTLGYADRPLGNDVITLTPKQMVLLATRAAGNAQFEAIPWRFETALLERFGASYKLYFNIFPV